MKTSHHHRRPDRPGRGRAVPLGLRPGQPGPWQRNDFRRRCSGPSVAAAVTPPAQLRRRRSPRHRPRSRQVGTLGTVLVGANGNTLYAFTKDVDGVSTCFDACAAAWPAVTVTDGFAPPAGVDPPWSPPSIGRTARKQLKIGKWPLYFYAGDGAPGRPTARASAASGSSRRADGTLIKGDAAPAPAAAARPLRQHRRPHPAPAAEPGGRLRPRPVVALAQVGNLGEVMVGANGHTLYAFTDDPEKQTTCFDACAAGVAAADGRGRLHHLRRAAGLRRYPPSTGRTAASSW